jgi:hypothetical protein
MKKMFLLIGAALVLYSPTTFAASDLHCVLKEWNIYVVDGADGPDTSRPHSMVDAFYVTANAHFPSYGCDYFDSRKVAEIVYNQIQNGRITPRQLAWAIAKSRRCR